MLQSMGLQRVRHELTIEQQLFQRGMPSEVVSGQRDKSLPY